MATDAVRKSMQGNKSKNTNPELIVRHALREAGYPGYRLQWKKAPGHPDIAYPGRRIAIFVNGCFWHRHEGCKLATTPKTNQDYWIPKFERNVARDKREREELEAQGWKVITVWECELAKKKLPETIEYLVVELEEAWDRADAAGCADAAEHTDAAGCADAPEHTDAAGCADASEHTCQPA